MSAERLLFSIRILWAQQRTFVPIDVKVIVISILLLHEMEAKVEKFDPEVRQVGHVCLTQLIVAVVVGYYES